MRPDEIRARRALEHLGREITGLRDSHDALARATQLRWSTIPVADGEGGTVEVPVTDLMQDSATAVVDLDVVKVDLALNEAATIAAGQAAAAANQQIIETQGAAAGAQTTATQALEALAPLSEVPGLIEDLDAGVTEAQRLANLGIGAAEAADTKAADAKTLADAAQKVADTAAEDIREQKKRFSFGEYGLIITDEGYSSAITIDNEGITMSQNGNPVSSWIGGTFSADIVEADVFRVGMHQWQKYPLEEGATVTGTVIKTVVT